MSLNLTKMKLGPAVIKQLYMSRMRWSCGPKNIQVGSNDFCANPGKPGVEKPVSSTSSEDCELCEHGCSIRCDIIHNIIYESM